MQMSLEKEELTGAVHRFLDGLFRSAALEIEFQCELADQVMNVVLDGADAALVLSDNARLLYAINHLLNRVFYEKSPGWNFIVDCRQYRASRATEIQLLAQKAAEQVRRSGNPFVLQPMPSSERRLVHLALVQEPGVRTQSEGTGMHRHVVILPA